MKSFAVYMRVDVCVVVDARDDDDAMEIAEREIETAVALTVSGPPTVEVCSVDDNTIARAKRRRS